MVYYPKVHKADGPDDNLWLKRRYSHFEEAVRKKKSLREWARAIHAILDRWRQWVHDRQGPMAIKVRKLDPIIQDGKDAYQAIKPGTTIAEATEMPLQPTKNKKELFQAGSELADEIEGTKFDVNFRNFYKISLECGTMKEMAKDKGN